MYAASSVHYHLDGEADRLLKERVRIINICGHPVAHMPLAVADFHSLDCDNDLASAHRIYPNHEGVTFSVSRLSQHNLYYLTFGQGAVQSGA